MALMGTGTKTNPFLVHSARFAQRQLERLQNIVDKAWSTETGMMTPKEWADLEYEQHRSIGPKHDIEHAETHLNYNRLYEGTRWGFNDYLFPDDEEETMHDSYIPGQTLIRSLDQWMEWAETRGAIHWTARAWEVFQLQPQLYPRMSERQKRFFHPQDEFYEMDYHTLRHIRHKRYFAEWYKRGRISTLWGVTQDPWHDHEGIMGKHEQHMMKFARDPRIREGMMNPYEFIEMHHHPSRLWKAQELREKAHKFWTFPNFKKDWNIAWSVRPKVHQKNEWFPERKEWDVMDDFDLEEPLFKHGELNPFIVNHAAVRQPILIASPDNHREAYNAEPGHWAGYERQMWSHMPEKTTPIRRFNVTRAFNMVRGELDTQLDDPTRQFFSKQSRYKPKGHIYTSARRANMDDYIKGHVLETQQFWGMQRKHMNEVQAGDDKRQSLRDEDEMYSSSIEWAPELTWQAPSPRF